jgi:transcriptional regulator with XRE-family HTH domain
MADNYFSVLHVNGHQETTAYRNAIACILLDVQSRHGMTLHEIAEAIDVSLGTISNAANKKSDLSPTFLKRIGEAFGPETLNPYAALSGGRMVPLQPTEDDPMPHLLALATALCQAKAEGRERDHRVKLAMIPELKAAQAAITNMILQAESIRV